MCNQCLLDPKMDFIFKRIFGNEKHPEILIRFLNAVLEPYSYTKPYDPIASLVITSPEISKSSIEDKYSILDVKAKTSKGETINIEIQRKDTSDMLRRSIYYLDEIFTEQIQSGEEYEKLERVVTIVIMNYKAKFITNDRFHNVYRFLNVATKGELTDLQELHYIELEKMIDCDQQDVLQLFLEFLKDPTSPVLHNPTNNVIEIGKAQEELARLSRQPAVREQFNAREKALKDRASELFNARAEGEAIGIEEGIVIGKEEGIVIGIEEEKINVARKLLPVMTNEEICDITELPLETITTLRKESSL